MNTKGKMNSEGELGVDYIGDTLHNQNHSIVDGMEIKHEGMDFQHDSASHSNSDGNCDLGTLHNILHVDCGSVKSEEKDLDDYYLDILKSDRCCEICQKYMKMLSRHVRAAHAPPQPQSIQDPLHIDHDPHNPEANQVSSIQIKCEIDECIDEKVEVCYSEDESESKCESDPEFELVNDNESDLDPSTSSSLSIRNVGHHGHLPNLLKKPASSRTENRTPSIWNNCTVPQNLHGGHKPFKCVYCGQSYSFRSGLTAHMRTHTGERPYVCELCEKSFKGSGELKRHKRVHTGEKPYHCDECGRKFSRSHHLTDHKRQHTEEKPYECTLCVTRFKTRSSLNAHSKVHTGRR